MAIGSSQPATFWRPFEWKVQQLHRSMSKTIMKLSWVERASLHRLCVLASSTRTSRHSRLHRLWGASSSVIKVLSFITASVIKVWPRTSVLWFESVLIACSVITFQFSSPLLQKRKLQNSKRSRKIKFLKLLATKFIEKSWMMILSGLFVIYSNFNNCSLSTVIATKAPSTIWQLIAETFVEAKEINLSLMLNAFRTEASRKSSLIFRIS
jgi:hypothetical protein